MKISKEYLDIALANGISKATVYRRVNEKKWTIEDAINTPTDAMEVARQQSKFYGLERGKSFITKLPLDHEGVDWDKKLTDAIADSGLTAMDFIAEVLVDYLKQQEQ